MKTILLATTCALALGAISSPALADDTYTNFPVSLSADFGHLAANGFDENTVGVNGSALYGLGWNNLSLALNGDYHYDWNGGNNANVGSIGGGFVWTGPAAMPSLRIGLAAQYQMLSGVEMISYGAGAEWFVNDWLTAQVHGGGLKVEPYSGSGGYVGAQLKGYVCPNFSLSGGIDYTSESPLAETDYNVRAEYAFWGNLAVNATYSYTHLTYFDVNANTFGIGLTLHLNGDATLKDNDRTGPAEYITNFRPVFFKYAF